MQGLRSNHTTWK